MRFLLFFLFFFFQSPSFGAIVVGAGTSSATSGRIRPGLYGAFETDSISISAFTTGTNNYYSYHSSYYGGFFLNTVKDGFWWGDIIGGFGLGMLYSERGFQDGDADDLTVTSDFVMGPSFRMSWNFAGPVFLGLEALFGIDPTSQGIFNHITLNFQDFVIMNAGVRF